MDATRRMNGLNEKGSTLALVAVTLFVFIAIAGLAVDLGHMYLVRNELQNAADASALSGAMKLYSSSSNPSIRPTVRWSEAKARSEADISLNKSDGNVLNSGLNGEVEVGFWNISTHTIPLKSKDLTPVNNDASAVRVRVFRNNGSSDNRVNSLLARIVPAFAKMAVSSKSAVAVRGFPSSFTPGHVFPIAVTKCLADNYFDQNPLPNPPTTIRIYSTYVFPNGTNCDTGQWTSFASGNNDAKTIKDYIDNGNNANLKIGDSIWIEPGAKTSIFQNVTDWINAGNGDVFIPIVDTVVKDDAATHSWQTIKGFAAFHIDRAVGGSNKYIEGHFLTYYETTPGIATPGGNSYYGAITPPVLVY